MASSYVEVRESENGTEGSMLQFELDPCESNGIDIPQHIDGEPPKDHTYNKDPEVIEADTAELTPEEKEMDTEDVSSESSKKASKNSKVSKQKSGKRAPKKPVKAAPKEEAAKKTEVKEDATKKVATRRKPKEDEEQPENNEIASSVVKIAEEILSNIQDADETEVQPKKRVRKRKVFDDAEDDETAKRKKSDPVSVVENAETNANKEVPETKEVEDEEPTVSEVTNETPSKQKRKLAKRKTVTPKKKVKIPKRVVKTPKKELKAPKKVVKVTPKKAKKVTEPVKAYKPSPVVKKKSKDVGKPDASLPPGWTRKFVERKSGKTAGLVDMYIYSPDGLKFRSRPDIAAYLARVKSSFKLEDFNFTKRGLTGTVNKSTNEKQKAVVRATEKPPAKTTSKPKKAAHSGANSIGKRGQKLLVKLNVGSPKKRGAASSSNATASPKRGQRSRAKTPTGKAVGAGRKKK